MKVVDCMILLVFSFWRMERRRTKWATTRRQIGEADFKRNANTIGGRGSRDLAFDTATRTLGVEEFIVREKGNIVNSNWIVLGHSRVSKQSGDWDSVALRSCKGEKYSPNEGLEY